jgi:hypothetical protein
MGFLNALFFRANKTVDQDKSMLANRIVAHSLSVTDPAVRIESGIPYTIRLHEVLMMAETRALRYIDEDRIAVCLDLRLPHARRGMYGPIVEALLYNNGPVKILSLSDSGWTRRDGDTLLYKHRDTINALSRIPEDLAEIPVLTRVPVFTGNSVRVGWGNAGEAQSTFTQNPGLHKAPAP